MLPKGVEEARLDDAFMNEAQEAYEEHLYKDVPYCPKCGYYMEGDETECIFCEKEDE